MVSVGEDVLTNEPSRNLKIQLSVMGPSVVTEAGATFLHQCFRLAKGSSRIYCSRDQGLLRLCCIGLSKSEGSVGDRVEECEGKESRV